MNLYKRRHTVSMRAGADQKESKMADLKDHVEFLQTSQRLLADRKNSVKAIGDMVRTLMQFYAERGIDAKVENNGFTVIGRHYRLYFEPCLHDRAAFLLEIHRQEEVEEGKYEWKPVIAWSVTDDRILWNKGQAGSSHQPVGHAQRAAEFHYYLSNIIVRDISTP